MTRYTPQWLQAGSYSAAQDRRLISALWPGPASTGCAVTASAGTMSVLIASGQVAVPTQNQSGSTLCSSDAIETVGPLTQAPASGTNRIDLIICRPRGNDLDGGANTDFIFDFVTGTPAATPAVPATPAGTVALAQISIPGGSASIAAGNITDVRPGGLAIPPSSGAGSPPRGHIASIVGPASQTDVSATTTVLTLTVALTAGRRYRVSAESLVSQQTATGNLGVFINDSLGLIPSPRVIWAPSLALGLAASGSGFWVIVAPTSGNATFNVAGSSSAGVCRFGANATQLVVEDIGT